MTKIAILDDYIGVALEYGDWSALPDDAEITVYREAIPPERLIEELSVYEIIVITQQRARFPRAVLEGLPNLKLLVCNGRTSNVIDHEARIERGILLCGTADTEPGAAARPAGPGPARPARALGDGLGAHPGRREADRHRGPGHPGGRLADRVPRPAGRPDARPPRRRAISAARWSRWRRRSAWTWSRGART